MSIKTVTFDELGPAISLLESLAFGHDTYVFRGHNRQEFRLMTTSERHYRLLKQVASPMLDDLLNRFRAGLAKIGQLPFQGDNRQDWLEFARHCGVPTPCIDFTHSPYVALFFAFTAAKEPSRKEEENDYVTVYGLNINLLAEAWLKSYGNVNDSNQHWLFREQDGAFFDNGFPESLTFLPQPGKFNKKMQKQLGALIYDQVHWKFTQFNDLEDFIEKAQELPEQLPNGIRRERGNTLTKAIINTKCIRDVFERLELMGITGASLFDDPAGVAMDIINSYYYNPKTSALRGISFPKVDTY